MSWSSTLNLKVFSWETLGAIYRCLGTSGNFFPFPSFLGGGGCLLPSSLRKSLQRTTAAGVPVMATCLDALNESTARGGNSPLQPSVRDTRATHAVKKRRTQLPPSSLSSASAPDTYAPKLPRVTTPPTTSTCAKCMRR